MNAYLNREKMTKILIPKGELLDDFLGLLGVLDLELQETAPGSLAYTLPKLALPLLFVAVRARDVGKTVTDPNCEPSFGFTGTDIVVEQGLDSIEKIPSRLLPKKSQIVFGSTPNWGEKTRRPRTENFPKGSTIVTAYPNITTTFSQQRSLGAKVIEKLGAIESYWWLDPENKAIVDVRVSGKTMQQNKIQPLEVILDDIGIELVAANPSMKSIDDQDAQVVEDFMRKFWRQVNSPRRKM